MVKPTARKTGATSTKHEGGRDTMKVRPLHDRIMVERLEEKEVKKGGIIIPDTAKEKPQEAKVIAVGNGKVGDDGKKIPLDVKAGDKILCGKYSGSRSRSTTRSISSCARKTSSPFSSKEERDPCRSSSSSTRRPGARCSRASTSWPRP